MTFHDTHNPLGAYFGAVERAGLLVEAIREPVPDDDHLAAFPYVRRWRHLPIFLLARTVKS
jgi:hypothetical protein